MKALKEYVMDVLKEFVHNLKTWGIALGLTSITLGIISCDKSGTDIESNPGTGIAKPDTVVVTQEINGVLDISEASLGWDPTDSKTIITYPGPFTIGSALNVVRSTTAIVTFENIEPKNFEITDMGKTPGMRFDNYKLEVKEGGQPLITNVVPVKGHFGEVKDAQGNTVVIVDGTRRYVKVIGRYKANSTSAFVRFVEPEFDPMDVFNGANRWQNRTKLTMLFSNVYF